MKKRVSKLTLTNFRCFENVTFDLDADIVIITGKNGAGKSTILYALTHVLNGKSKDSILNYVGELKNVKSAKNNGYKIKVVLANGDEEEIDGDNLPEYDDSISFRKENLSTFFQEYISEYDLNWLLNFVESFEGEGLIKITRSKALRTEWIKMLRNRYLPSRTKEYEYRKEFLQKWTHNIKMFSESFRRKFFYVFENKGLTEESYKKFFEQFCKEHDIQIENQKGFLKGRNEFLNIISAIKHFLEKIEKDEKDEKDKTDRMIKYEQVNKLETLSRYRNKTIVIIQTNEDFEMILKGEHISEGKIFLFKKEIYKRALEKKKGLECEINVLSEKMLKLHNILFAFNLENYEGSFEDVVTYLKRIKNNIRKLDKNLLPEKIVKWVMNTNIEELEKEYEIWKGKIEKEINIVEQHLSNKRRVLNVLKNGLDFSEKFYLIFGDKYEVKGEMTVSDLIKQKALKDKTEQSYSDLFIIGELKNLLDKQIEKEYEIFKKIVRDEKIRKKEKEIKSIIETVEMVLNEESKKNSILNSIMQKLSREELDKIIEPVNTFLKLFHYPEGFLPLKIERRKRNYLLKTASNYKLNYKQLSTGQKAILNIAFGVAANLLFKDELDHDVIMFDDITTSLDLSQLIPAAILFRKLAYIGKRQVILTTHHEDLTNKLLDYLIPPEERSLKVIEFYDWPYDAGKNFNIYYMENKSKNAEKKDLEDIKYLIADDYLSFVQNND